MTDAVQNLELFGPVALAYLIDGPKPQTALNGQVPVSVLEHLRSTSMIGRKMLWHGSVATAWWYMADDAEPTFSEISVKPQPGCDDCGIFHGMQEGGLPA
jgi:hypothetical protein